jgi:hypothetical protein
MHVHSTWSGVRHGDDVDVVGRVGLCGLDRGRLTDAVKPFTIAIDSLVNPVGWVM